MYTHTRETISDFAERIILPRLMQPIETPYHLPIHMNGVGSRLIGRTVIEDGRASLQEQVETEEYRVVTVIKPGQRLAHRNVPSYKFLKALEHQTHQEEESKSPENYKELGRKFPDIPFDELPNHLGGAYATYNDGLNPDKSGFIPVAHADGSGVYLADNSHGNHSERGRVGSVQDAGEIERIQERVIRSVTAIALEEELYERKALDVVKNLANVLVRDAISEKIDLSKIRVKPSGFAYVHAARQGDSVEVSVDISMFTGLERKGGQIISDHKYLSGALKDLKRIDGIGPYDGLHFERKRDPEIIDLTRSKQPDKPPYPYLVQAMYTAKLTKDTLLATYEEQKQLAA